MSVCAADIISRILRHGTVSEEVIVAFIYLIGVGVCAYLGGTRVVLAQQQQPARLFADWDWICFVVLLLSEGIRPGDSCENILRKRSQPCSGFGSTWSVYSYISRCRRYRTHPLPVFLGEDISLPLGSREGGGGREGRGREVGGKKNDQERPAGHSSVCSNAVNKIGVLVVVPVCQRRMKVDEIISSFLSLNKKRGP